MEIKRIFDIPKYQLEKNPLKRALGTKKNRIWNYLSTNDYVDRINSISRGLLDLGVKKGDKIAIISENRNEWAITDMAIQQLGGVVVPIYPTISNKDYEYIFSHAEIKFCFVSNNLLYDKVKNLISKDNNLEKIISFDNIVGVDEWESILKKGNSNTELQKDVEDIKDTVKGDDLVTIIYTSGTTGKPKGVMLSHKNIIVGAINTLDRIKLKSNKKGFSFLPMCHIFERMCVYAYQYSFNSVFFSSIDTIVDDIKEVSPNYMATVPRLLEKIYEKIYNKGKRLSFIKRNLFFWAIAVGREYVPHNKPLLYKMKLIIARKLIFKKWKEALGGNLEVIISGGATLQKTLCKVFSASGMKVMEGYGLTESCAAASINGPRKNSKMGTVGKKTIDEIKIDDDGEVLLKGDNIMLGYYKDEENTKETIKDGYLHTGDIGIIDEQGFLKITDRKKEMFKTSGGKYIAPQYVEGVMKESFFIEQAIVIGDNQKYPAIIIQPDFEFLKNWCKEREIEVNSMNEIINNKKVVERVQQEIDKRNTVLGDWEKIKNFKMISDTWGIETGELTPTLKLKRKYIIEKYKSVIEKIYEE